MIRITVAIHTIPRGLTEYKAEQVAGSVPLSEIARILKELNHAVTNREVAAAHEAAKVLSALAVQVEHRH